MKRRRSVQNLAVVAASPKLEASRASWGMPNGQEEQKRTFNNVQDRVYQPSASPKVPDYSVASWTMPVDRSGVRRSLSNISEKGIKGKAVKQ